MCIKIIAALSLREFRGSLNALEAHCIIHGHLALM